ncbi:MAG: spermidine/putrescine ABC transporter substrate-binding protein [Terrimicrobiaceae bacterium]|nr:spermidine/putrescine ABC transporter substrate-binding protein [Terrimicrobiaceae bacterium]
MKTTRHLLTLGAVAAALALAGCGKPAAPETPKPAEPAKPAAAASPATPAAETAAAEEPAANYDTGEPKELNLFCWSEYVPQSVIDRFTKATGIKVNVENYASNEEMKNKLLSGGGQYDLIQPSEYIIEAFIKNDLLLKLDHSLIPNLKNLAPEFQHLPFDPNHDYSVPWMAGTVGIVVNTELIPDDIKGYADVFQDKYKGRIVVLDDAREIVSWGLETLGIPVNQVSDENLEKVKPLVAKWLPLVKVYDSDSPKTALLNGDVAVGVVWSGEGAILTHENKKFKWVLPSEGVHLFVDSLAVPKTATHPKNAQLFMNFILRPKISTLISDDFPYLNPNAAARKLLKPEQLANVASFPTPEEIAKMQTFQDIGQQASKIDDLVTTLKVQ